MAKQPTYTVYIMDNEQERPTVKITIEKTQMPPANLIQLVFGSISGLVRAHSVGEMTEEKFYGLLVTNPPGDGWDYPHEDRLDS